MTYCKMMEKLFTVIKNWNFVVDSDIDTRIFVVTADIDPNFPHNCYTALMFSVSPQSMQTRTITILTVKKKHKKKNNLATEIQKIYYHSIIFLVYIDCSESLVCCVLHFKPLLLLVLQATSYSSLFISSPSSTVPLFSF